MSTVLALVLVAFSFSAPASARQSAAGAPELRSLDFQGNVAFPDDSLRLGIVNRQTECRPFLAAFCLLGLSFAYDREVLIRREIPRDVARLHIYYHQRGYRDARVDTALVYEDDGSRARLTFSVQEGRPVLIGSLRFVGDTAIAGGRPYQGLPLREGDPLNAVRMDEARDTLVGRLRNEGYVGADVLRSSFVPASDPYAAQLTFDIDAGPRARIGPLDIRVNGQAGLSETVVRRMLPFQEGSVYNASELQQGQRNLFGLDIVQNALIVPDTALLRTLPDSVFPLVIEVGTSTLRRIRLGGGWNTSDCLSAEARWANRNVLGGAQRLQVAGRLSNLLAESLHASGCPLAGVEEFGGINWSISTELNLPWVFSPRNSLSTSLFWERQSLPDVFIRQSIGLNVAFTRNLGLRMPLILSYRPQLTRLEAAGIFFCTSLLVCNPEDISVLEDPNWLSPVALGISRDRTDNLFNPSGGYAAQMEVELASRLTGSDFAYRRVTAEASAYWAPTGRTVLAGRLRGGWVGAADFGRIESGSSQIIHPQKRFFAGGAGSVRGFAQNALGPRVLTVGVGQILGPAQVVGGDTILVGACPPETVMDFTCDTGVLADEEFTPRPTGGTRLLEGNLEYRMGFGSLFQGVGFLDFGQVWNEQAVLSLGAVEWTPGVGVRYFSPIGPLRLDVAYRSMGGQPLPVVTSRVRPFVEGQDAPQDRIALDLVNAQRQPTGAVVLIPWVRQEELALLSPAVTYGANPSFFNRLQIHISIGQAF